MLSLIRTLVDITLLRKGPEDIPYSWVLLHMCIALWMLALLATAALITNFDATDAWVSLASAIVGAIFTGTQATKMRALLDGDGTSNTICILDVNSENAVPWASWS